MVDLRQIKLDFFAFRNGIIADALRKAGDPHTVILGCQLVDIVAIAQNIGDDDSNQELARALWADEKSRESRLLAPMVYPSRLMPMKEATEWLLGVISQEEADVLCHRLLQHLPDARRLTRLSARTPLQQYAIKRLNGFLTN